MKLDLRDLLTGHTTRLKTVVRFGNAHRIANESVAEHMYFVTLYAVLIGRWYEASVEHSPRRKPLDWQRLMEACVLHDVEEGLSGDFPHDFKYSDLNVLTALQTAGRAAFGRVFHDTTDTGQQQSLNAVWLSCKEGMEGTILTFADMCSTVSYVWLEVQRGNRLILRNAADVPQNVTHFFSDRYLPLFPLATQLRELVKEIYA